MEYSIGFKRNDSNTNFVLHSLILTPDNKTGILDYEPNKNVDKIKVKLSLDDNDYNSYNKTELTILDAFMIDKNTKVYNIKYCDNYIAFKNKKITFKEEEILFENGVVTTIPNNNNYENPNIEQSVTYLEGKYKFSSTSEAYAIMNVITELKKLKYSKI